MILFIQGIHEYHFKVFMRNGEIHEYRGCTIRQFLNRLCICYGFTYEGSRRAISKSLHIRRDLPLYLNNQLLLFPIKDLQNQVRVWINYAVLQESIWKGKECHLFFQGQVELTCVMSNPSFERQKSRCYFYLYVQKCYQERTQKKLPV